MPLCCNNREQERLDWAVEVLVTRSELDEKKNRMAELEQQVRRASRAKPCLKHTIAGQPAQILPGCGVCAILLRLCISICLSRWYACFAAQVAELTMQTEYQLRLKDLHLQERVKELTEKFTAELENDRQKFELLLQVRLG